MTDPRIPSASPCDYTAERKWFEFGTLAVIPAGASIIGICEMAPDGGLPVTLLKAVGGVTLGVGISIDMLAVGAAWLQGKVTSYSQ